MIALVLIATAFLIWDSRQTTVKTYQARQNRRATVLAEQAGRDFRAVDLAVREIIDHIAASGSDTEETFRRSASEETTHRAIQKILTHQIEALTLTDAGGMLLLYSTRSSCRPGRDSRRSNSALSSGFRQRAVILAAQSPVSRAEVGPPRSAVPSQRPTDV
jgi:hypothetical protein